MTTEETLAAIAATISDAPVLRSERRASPPETPTVDVERTQRR